MPGRIREIEGSAGPIPIELYPVDSASTTSALTKDHIEADARKAQAAYQAAYLASSIAPASTLSIYQKEDTATKVDPAKRVQDTQASAKDAKVDPAQKTDNDSSFFSKVKDKAVGLYNWLWSFISDEKNEEISPKNLTAEEKEKLQSIIALMRLHLSQIKDITEDTTDSVRIERRVFELIEDRKELSQLTRERTLEQLRQKREIQQNIQKTGKEGLEILGQKKFLDKFSGLTTFMQLLAVGLDMPNKAGKTMMALSVGVLADTIFDDNGKRWLAKWFKFDPNEQDKFVYYVNMGLSALAMIAILKLGVMNAIASTASIVKGGATIAKTMNEKRNNKYDATMLDLNQKYETSHDKVKAGIKDLNRELKTVNNYFKTLQQNQQNSHELMISLARFVQ